MALAPLVVTTPAGAYDVIVGAGLLADVPAYLDRLGLRGRIWLIGDEAPYRLYGEPLLGRLRAAGFNGQGYSVPAGEASKDLAHVAQLYDWLIGGGVERRDVVLALGGGVVGDLAGFVAATTLRGIAFVQLPTTLLAMVDSAIGGKTGVNHSLGKNLIGAFHQPRLVLSDVDTLASLPARELRSGWAETIKHGVIRDADLFRKLEDWRLGLMHTGDIRATVRDPHVASLIRQSAAVKVEVVNIDERELGERVLLNYGHTLGHALEAALGYGVLLHGEAIAIGLDLAGRIAVALGMFAPADLARQRRLLETYGLAVALPAAVTPDQLIALSLRDKKVRAGSIRWVLPTAIGTATTRADVPENLVRAVLEAAERR